jgi:hypothetical protein
MSLMLPRIRVRVLFSRSVPVLAILLLLSFTAPALAVWLPWATEEAKVKKAVVDVWQALINNDQRFLAEHVAGSGAKVFIEKELALIQSLGIKNYDCRIKKVTILAPDPRWAIVEFDKVATLSSGEQFTYKAYSLLGKADGEWKIMMGVTDKMKLGQEVLNLLRQGAGVPAQPK